MKNYTQKRCEELREYFDQTLKPKKPTMKNLDRELLVNFLSESIQQAEQEMKEQIMHELSKHIDTEDEYYF